MKTASALDSSISPRRMPFGWSAISRRLLLKGGGAAVGAGTLLGAGARLGTVSTTRAAARTLIFDVACDGRTFRLLRMNPADTSRLPRRGDAFIVNGKIYPGGTIERGLTGPDQPGSIGTWVCRGWIYVEDLAMETPHAATTQLYLFTDGNGLASDGLEGGVPTLRAVVGGQGVWDRATGEVAQEALETNDTLLDLGPARVPAPNFRFIFRLDGRS